MDYQKHYDALIHRANNRCLETYKERHHVIPKCMGGTDNQSNLVDLTPEEHYVAHQLLLKIYPCNDKLVYAAHMMSCGRDNKLYGWVRRKYLEVCKLRVGPKNSSFGTHWANDGISSFKVRGEDPLGIGISYGRLVGKRVIKTKVEIKREAANQKRAEQIEHVSALYAAYMQSGCKSIREYARSGLYDKSHVNLTRLFKRYIPEYSK